jgi:hypothetical protein
MFDWRLVPCGGVAAMELAAPRAREHEPAVLSRRLASDLLYVDAREVLQAPRDRSEGRKYGEVLGLDISGQRDQTTVGLVQRLRQLINARLDC